MPIDFPNFNDILLRLKVRAGHWIAEFYCGNGNFSLHAAAKTDKGRVYAIDVRLPRLSALRAIAKHHPNMRIVHGNLQAPRGSSLPDHSVDLVAIANPLFPGVDKYAILTEAKRIIKPGGKLLTTDWSHDTSAFRAMRTAGAESTQAFAKELGFSKAHEFASGSWHHCLIFTT